jgi:hypothetical protein
VLSCFLLFSEFLCAMAAVFVSILAEKKDKLQLKGGSFCCCRCCFPYASLFINSSLPLSLPMENCGTSPTQLSDPPAVLHLFCVCMCTNDAGFCLCRMSFLVLVLPGSAPRVHDVFAYPAIPLLCAFRLSHVPLLRPCVAIFFSSILCTSKHWENSSSIIVGLFFFFCGNAL